MSHNTSENRKSGACLAFDLGASSWRAALATLNGPDICLEEIFREENVPVQTPSGLFWDFDRIFAGIKGVLRKVAASGVHLLSIGIDSWSVDYGLLDEAGNLIEPPRCYRDPRNQGMLDKLAARIGLQAVFARTGVMAEEITTLCQLLAARERTPTLLDRVDSLLFIPDLLRYQLCGQRATDFTLASTSQLFNLSRNAWDEGLIALTGLPFRAFPQVRSAGVVLGRLSGPLQAETGLGPVPIATGASHDTAAAFAAANADENTAILSSGTWSILGVNLPRPLETVEIDSRRFGYEGNPDGTVRLIHNMAGLWLLERCRAEWQRAGNEWSYDALMAEARRCSSFSGHIDPHAPEFVLPENMLEAIRDHLCKAGQPVPSSPGQFTRAILLGLAESYAHALNELRDLTGKTLERLVIVGGGAQNALLNEFTERRVKAQVTPGFVEATLLGNVQNQRLALDTLA